MIPVEIRSSLVALLSASRREADPRYCQSLTKRQILSHIDEMIAPRQDSRVTELFHERISEQLERLVQEFEIIRLGDSRLQYCMAPPSLIMSREEPLLAQYVGDRAYLSLTCRLIDGEYNELDNLVGSRMSIDEAREALEHVGISVQTEEMLFQSVPDPVVPTEIELSIAERFDKAELNQSMLEVYAPRREDLFTSRWLPYGQTAPSACTDLYRIKIKSSYRKEERWSYLWQKQVHYCKLTSRQAFLAMYRIDLDKNSPRLLNLDQEFAYGIKWHLPMEYARLVSRYTVESEEHRGGSIGDDSSFSDRRLRVRPKYKSLIKALLEVKLGINQAII